jgi:hypothetical protein
LEQVPDRLLLWEYVPSVHFADAPVGSVLLALVDEVAVELVVAVWVVAGFGGADGATGAAAAGAAAAAPVPTPPWCEHAPLPVVVLVVPSLHVTVAPVDAVLVGAAGAAAAEGAVAALGAVAVLVGVPTPPWCEQAPLPVFVLVVPSLHETVVPLDAV